MNLFPDIEVKIISSSIVEDVFVDAYCLEKILKGVSVDYRGLNFDLVRNFQIITDDRMKSSVARDLASTFLPNKLRDKSISSLLGSSLNPLLSLRGNDDSDGCLATIFIDKKALRMGKIRFGENNSDSSICAVECGTVI